MIDEPTLAERIHTLEHRVADLQVEVDRLNGLLQLPARPRVVAPLPIVVPQQDLEARIGSNWVGRAGILALTTGIAFLIVYRFGDLGPTARILLGYLLGAGLTGLGLWLGKRHELLSRLVIGGGLAVTYFVTFALHFVPSVRVIDSEPLAFAVLALVVGGIVATAQVLKSETVAGFAMFLGLHTGFLSQVGTFTLLSATLLAGGAVFFVIRNRWVFVPITSLVGVYSTHAAFILRHGSQGPLDLGFAAIYFTLFSTALIIRPAGLSRSFATSFAQLNWLGAVGLVLATVGVDHHPTFALACLAAELLILTLLSLPLGAMPQIAPVYLPAAALTGIAAVLFDKPASSQMIFAIGLVAALLGRLIGHGALATVGALALAGQFLADAASEPPIVSRMTLIALLFLMLERLHATPWRLPDPPLSDRTDTPPWPTLLTGLYPLLVGGTGLVVAPLLIAGRTWAWLAVALVLGSLGFALRANALRWVGLVALAFSLLHFLTVDLPERSTDYRIVALLLLGGVLLGTSYAYSRLRDRVGQWL